MYESAPPPHSFRTDARTDLAVDDGGDGEAVEAVGEGLPQLDVVPPVMSFHSCGRLIGWWVGGPGGDCDDGPALINFSCWKIIGRGRHAKNSKPKKTHRLHSS